MLESVSTIVLNKQEEIILNEKKQHLANMNILTAALQDEINKKKMIESTHPHEINRELILNQLNEEDLKITDDFIDHNKSTGKRKNGRGSVFRISTATNS